MSDLIDREALLRQIDIDSEGEPGYYGDTWKFIDTIKRMPSAHGTNLAEVGTDCISRWSAIDALRAMQTYKLFAGDDMLLIDQAGAQTELMLLPPIQPKRGRWIKLDMHRGMADHKCSVCEQECYVPTCMDKPMYAFCPNCGAKMEATE